MSFPLGYSFLNYLFIYLWGIINMGSASTSLIKMGSTPRKNVRIGSAGYGWYVVCVNVRMGSAGSGAHTELLPILRNTQCRAPSLHATLRTA